MNIAIGKVIAMLWMNWLYNNHISTIVTVGTKSMLALTRLLRDAKDV